VSWTSLVGLVAIVTAAYVLGVSTFERVAPARWVRAYRLTANRAFRPVLGFVLGWAILETTGRRSGLRRQTPIGGRLSGDTYWLIAGDGRRAAYVRNIEADPRVRLKVHGRWRKGTAHLLHEDDARRRLLRLNPVNSLFVLIASKEPMTVRIDLDRHG
jgi:deazaflavin-dependent oxidoreductase (nitroreductase family)